MGSLAHLLKNRFYLGEVLYRGEVHRGEHEPILGRDLFEAVQAKRDVGNTCCPCNPNRSIRPDGDFPIPAFVSYG